MRESKTITITEIPGVGFTLPHLDISSKNCQSEDALRILKSAYHAIIDHTKEPAPKNELIIDASPLLIPVIAALKGEK